MVSKNQIKLIRQLDQKKYRRREGLFVAEGPKVVGDLLRAGFRPTAVFATEEWGRADAAFPSVRSSASEPVVVDKYLSEPVTLVSDDELRKLSFLQHPQQVLALFPIPEPLTQGFDVNGLCIALDGIQDPGNLGTIIRIADWFGISTIYCSEGTADAWNPKVVQATMGSIARVNIIYTDLARLIDSIQVPVYGTLLDGENIYTQPLSSEGLIVMGNEGNGISPDIRQRITHRLLIPDFHDGETAESLNVAIATAITCSEFRRRSMCFHKIT